MSQSNDSGLNLDHMEALARAATPGPWTVRLDGTCSGTWPHVDAGFDEYDDPITVTELSTSHTETEAARTGGEMPGSYEETPHRFELYDQQPLDDAAFIAAANPAAVLELIALARRATQPVAAPQQAEATGALAVDYIRPLRRLMSAMCMDSDLVGPDEYVRGMLSTALREAAERLESAATSAPSTREAPADDDLLETVARAIWNVRREEEDRCDMELEDMGDDHPVWDEAEAAVAAIQRVAQLDGGQEGSAT